jgi:hypothetical protein
MMATKAFCVAVGLLLLAGQTGEKMEVVKGTSGSRSAALEVQAGGLVLREGAVGSAFGTFRAGTGKRQLSYFLLIRHHLGGSGKSDFSEETTVEDAEGESKQSLTIDGKSLLVEHKVKLDPVTRQPAREALTVNRKAVDVSRGRVLLVDLTVSPPKWEQRKLALPAEVPGASSKKAAEELARKVLASLVKQDSKVKAFVDAAGK